MENRRSKIFSAVYFACIISCILLSAYLVSDVWARYFAEATGTAGARVAKFDVSAEFTGEDTNLTLSEGVTSVSYPFSVTSSSEVAVTYDVVLILPSDLPNGLLFTINGVEPKANGSTYTFSNVGSFDASIGTNEHALTVTATEFDNSISLSPIKIKIAVSQID